MITMYFNSFYYVFKCFFKLFKLFIIKLYVRNNVFNTTSISIDEVKINKIVLFDKTSYGNNGLFKYYIGYRHKDGIFSPLNVKLSQLTGYSKHFNDSKYIITDKKLLKKYSGIWGKIQ